MPAACLGAPLAAACLPAAPLGGVLAAADFGAACLPAAALGAALPAACLGVAALPAPAFLAGAGAFLACCASVSYTHLDVYKRQL